MEKDIVLNIKKSFRIRSTNITKNEKFS